MIENNSRYPASLVDHRRIAIDVQQCAMLRLRRESIVKEVALSRRGLEVLTTCSGDSSIHSSQAIICKAHSLGIGNTMALFRTPSFFSACRKQHLPE
jgi:hypothetical protein